MHDLSADIQPCYRRIMVADLRIKVWPRINVDVFEFRPALFGKRRRHKHVIELLSVHVEEIGVAFDFIIPDNCVKVLQT